MSGKVGVSKIESRCQERGYTCRAGVPALVTKDEPGALLERIDFSFRGGEKSYPVRTNYFVTRQNRRIGSSYLGVKIHPQVVQASSVSTNINKVIRIEGEKNSSGGLGIIMSLHTLD